VSAFYDLQDKYGQGTNGAWQANNTRSWGDRMKTAPCGRMPVNKNGAFFTP